MLYGDKKPFCVALITINEESARKLVGGANGQSYADLAQRPEVRVEVEKAIARVNDPRNQAHFQLLGISQTICATTSILGLVEHELPDHGLVRLLDLQSEGLAIVEIQIESKSPAAGSRVGGIRVPEGSRLISIFRHGRSELVDDKSVLRPGDQVLALVHRESAIDLRRALLGAPRT
jgi:Trk K+ transport system NAD-binding subunit